jgi:protein-S-isoprenylcysteine O-methyltransferase Ste14
MVYEIAWMVLFVVFSLIRIPHAIKNKANVHEKTEGKAREKVLVFIASLGMVIVPLVWVFSSAFQVAEMALPDVVRIAGIAAAVLSLWLFYEVHKALGRNWSPVLQIREGHTLVREGPYRRIRHPMYTQIWIYVIAQVLITSNWIVGATGIVTWAILYFIRVPREEKMMEEEFGEEYLAYKQQTGRILPKF